MKKNLTELVFIIDRSGSMDGLESDTIGGFNSMLKEQQALEGEAFVTTVLFDNEYKLLHDRIDIRAVAPLTEKDYTVRGTTALLDAVGKTINKIRAVQKHMIEDYRAEKVLFVIITDGHENASREYSAKRIKEKIEHQKKKYGWEFIFFGANMDAVAEAEKIGISAARAQNYCANETGTRTAYTAMSGLAAAYRNENLIDTSNSSTDVSVKPDVPSALANLKSAIGGAAEAAGGLVDIFKNITNMAEANNGKIPNVNDIARKILEKELTELEMNGGDEARINQLKGILKK